VKFVATALRAVDSYPSTGHRPVATPCNSSSKPTLPVHIAAKSSRFRSTPRSPNNRWSKTARCVAVRLTWPFVAGQARLIHSSPTG